MRILIDFPGKVPRGDALRTHLIEKVLTQLPEAVHVRVYGWLWLHVQ